jgi:hypothetical protein
MAEPNWLPASVHLPQDNRLVLLKGRYITAPRIVTDVPSRADVEKLSLVIAAAIALCEVAQENFVRINDELQRTIAELGRPSVFLLLEQEHAQRSLFDARIRLSKRLSERHEALKNIARSQPEPDPPPSNVRPIRKK